VIKSLLSWSKSIIQNNQIMLVFQAIWIKSQIIYTFNIFRLNSIKFKVKMFFFSVQDILDFFNGYAKTYLTYNWNFSFREFQFKSFQTWKWKTKLRNFLVWKINIFLFEELIFGTRHVRICTTLIIKSYDKNNL